MFESFILCRTPSFCFLHDIIKIAGYAGVPVMERREGRAHKLGKRHARACNSRAACFAAAPAARPPCAPKKNGRGIPFWTDI